MFIGWVLPEFQGLKASKWGDRRGENVLSFSCHLKEFNNQVIHKEFL